MNRSTHLNGHAANGAQAGQGDEDLALAYVIGEMEPGEAGAFERRLAGSPALRAEVERWREARHLGREWIESDVPGIERLLTLELPDLDEMPDHSAWGPLRAFWERLFPGADPVKGLAWAGTFAAAIVIVALVSGLRPPPAAAPKPGPGQVASLGASPVEAPVGGGPFAQGSPIRTAKEHKWLFRLSDDVRCAMNGATEVQLDSSREITLAEGEVWLWVAPGGKGFAVKTPHGRVTVHGTSFGVSVADGQTRVEAAEGMVTMASASGAAVEVASGRRSAMTASAVDAAASRTEGAGLPPWVSQVESGGANAWIGAFLPSMSEAK